MTTKPQAEVGGTPRTDAKVRMVAAHVVGVTHETVMPYEAIPAVDARQLERELAAAQPALTGQCSVVATPSSAKEGAGETPIYSGLEGTLRQNVDYGGYDGRGPDALRISAANAIATLRTALVSQVDITNTERVAKERLEREVAAERQERRKWYDLNDYAERRILELTTALTSEKAAREAAERERDEAQHWRERHNRDSIAANKQSGEHWQKWKSAESRVR